MKTIYFKRMLTMVCMFALLLTTVRAGRPAETAKSENEVKVKKSLVVGLPDNVGSNFFPLSMIAEETGLPEDSIDYVYNRAVADNIVRANKDRRYQFLRVEGPSVSGWMERVSVKGEDEEAQYADLSQVDEAAYRQWMDTADADYVLLLNRHYLKWQEKPLRTLFHITSYSLYDNRHREVARGNHYFTSMALDNREQLEKDSRKTSSRIAQNVVRQLSK